MIIKSSVSVIHKTISFFRFSFYTIQRKTIFSSKVPFNLVNSRVLRIVKIEHFIVSHYLPLKENQFFCEKVLKP